MFQYWQNIRGNKGTWLFVRLGWHAVIVCSLIGLKHPEAWPFHTYFWFLLANWHTCRVFWHLCWFDIAILLINKKLTPSLSIFVQLGMSMYIKWITYSFTKGHLFCQFPVVVFMYMKIRKFSIRNFLMSIRKILRKYDRWTPLVREKIRVSYVNHMFCFGLLYEPRHEKTCLRDFQPDSNQAAQPQKLGRGLKFHNIETRDIIVSRQRTTKVLIRLHGCAGWSAPLLFA